MQVTNIWNKLHIHRTKVVVTFMLLMLSGSIFAQRKVAMNNPNYDDRFLSYGFLIGLHTSTYQLKYSDAFVSRELDSLYSISPSWSPGFSLGFIVNFNLSEFLDVRVTPKVSFYEHRLEYQRLDAPNIEELVETTVVELPLLVKYKSERRGNFRMYMIGGIKPGFEASGKNDVDEISKENLDIRAFNMSFDVGFGIDMYYPLFKFSPEIRFSKGITNMLGNDNSDLGRGIDRLNTNTITLYLLFQ